MARRYWLMKSEPDVFSIDDLERDGRTPWEGIRNYQARNFMRDDMKIGDGVLYYHSNTKPPGIVGVARICREAYPDDEQFDPDSRYFDAKSTREEPRWLRVDIEFVGKFDEKLSLDELKADDGLDGMLVIRRGQRLSVQPVEERHWRRVLELAGYEE